MLVLTRKVSERIVIGEDIVLIITKIEGNRVKVGIEAPLKVSIQRGELQAKRNGRDPGRSIF